MEKEASFYEESKGYINCKLCPHKCLINDGAYGKCNVRVNRGGKLYTTNYGEITSMARDPIEKKPLYHFKPGGNILSVGSFGCNFSCEFCQNHAISQGRSNSEYIYPKQLVEICKGLEDNIGVAFTYNEPSIWYEYVYQSSKLLKESIKNINIVLVTNGYINEEPIKKLLPFVDAMNIDLKSFNNNYYKGVCGGSISPVLNTIRMALKECHVEVTTLLVSGENDSKSEVKEIAGFIGSLNKDIPFHLSRYFPNYKMGKPATNIEVMNEDRKIAERYLNYVYMGNVSNIDNSTYCPKCGYKIIEREGNHIIVDVCNQLCPKCGYKINIV